MDIKVNDLLGVPYKDHGRDLAGMDCYGLAIEVSRRYGNKLNDVFYEDNAAELCDIHAPTLNIKKIEKPEPGALLEMRIGNTLHIGVCINDREFIHMTRGGCRINQIGIIKVRAIYGFNSCI